MHPKKIVTILLPIGLLLFAHYSMNVSPIVSDEGYTYMSGLSWHSSFEEGQKAALEHDKPMLVYFWATWCKFCKSMRDEVYVYPAVNKILKEDFVLVAVDLDTNEKDAQAFDIWVPPAELFVTPEGDIIDQVGGYMQEDNFLVVLQQVKSYYGDRGQT